MKCQLDEAQTGIETVGRNINNLRYAHDTTLMAESEEELKSLLMRVNEESGKSWLETQHKKKQNRLGFPGGSAVKNSPANAGDTGSIPDPRRSHRSQSNKAHEQQLLSLCSIAEIRSYCSRTLYRAHALRQEKPPQ